jgi:hypothetical protein
MYFSAPDETIDLAIQLWCPSERSSAGKLPTGDGFVGPHPI